MQCIRPFRLNREGGDEFLVPCGRCIPCRISRNREWALRLMHETDYHERSAFVTLTYDPEHLPADQSLNVTELQRFFKRLRRRLGDRKIRYYACGEYGERDGRPHYHAIVFGLDPIRDRDLTSGAWSLGFVYLGSVTYDSCRYVSGYIMKKIYGSLQQQAYNGRTPPFQVQSRGLGRRFAEDNAAKLRKDLTFTYGGIPQGLPRYYQKVLGLETDDLRPAGDDHRQDLYDHYSDRGLPDSEIFPAIQKARRAADKTAQARRDLYHKEGKL